MVRGCFNALNRAHLTRVERPVHAISQEIGGDISRDDAILSLSKDYPSIRYYLFEHFGQAGINYTNWSEIIRNGVRPKRLYIVIIARDGTPEGAPEEAIQARGLDPAEYTTPEIVQMYDEVLLYVAYRTTDGAGSAQ